MQFISKTKPTGYIDSRGCIQKPESSMTCLTGYSDFILHEQQLIVLGQTHT